MNHNLVGHHFCWHVGAKSPKSSVRLYLLGLDGSGVFSAEAEVSDGGVLHDDPEVPRPLLQRVPDVLGHGLAQKIGNACETEWLNRFGTKNIGNACVRAASLFRDKNKIRNACERGWLNRFGTKKKCNA